MALTKVTKTGITDNAIDADKIEDGTVLSADIAPGTIENAKLANSSITVNGSSVSLGGSVTAKHIDWQAVKTTDFNAVAGEGYFVDTDSVGAVTATLPGSPSAGDTIAFKDYAANFGTNNLTIGRNGNNIQGVANDSLISTNRASIVLVYIDATKGWLYTNESNVADLGPTFISATGGTVTESGDYKIHTFTGDGCFVVSQLGCGIPCAQASTVDYLVVAGGGSGGNNHAGGGGAGGFRESKDSTLNSPHTASPLAATTGITVTASTYPITVGAGGAASSGITSRSNSGSNSVFSTITSTGGGAGGNRENNGAPPVIPGLPGGSGGGVGGASNPGTIGSGNTPPTSPPQGNNGGTTVDAGTGGGGGGATAVGTPHPAGTGGTGGTTSISGTPTAYAGGGGGGNSPAPLPAGNGGTGGGGTGGPSSAQCCSAAGTANTGGGGGGGGGGDKNGKGGGKGIVIIRYKFQ
jgi:hypothetical protein